jgi:tripartite-type tricarboxylate transporter receptor subunit TctC
MSRVLSDPALQDKLRSQAAKPVGDSPAEFAQIFRRNIERLAKPSKAAGARVD